MPSPRPPDHRAPAPASRGARWLVEVGPLAAIVTLLWAKLVYCSALLPSEWWAPEETIIQWMRPAFHVVGAIQRHPEMLGATLAALLVVAAPLLLLPRRPRLLALLVLDVLLTSVALTDLVHVRYYADVVSLSDVVMAPMVVAVLPRVDESTAAVLARKLHQEKSP